MISSFVLSHPRGALAPLGDQMTNTLSPPRAIVLQRGNARFNSMSQGLAIVARILQQFRRIGWGMNDILAVRLGLEEAIQDSIQHGNGSSPEKIATIRWRLNDKLFGVRIEDQGNGFDPSTVPDPTRPENIENPRGRGLLLMRGFMTRVRWNRKGNRVFMGKRAAA